MTKKTVCFFFILLGIFRTNAQIISIPDSEFERYLIDENIDSDATLNGQVLTSDITGVTTLNITSYNISNFQGLQYFSALTDFTLINDQSPSSFTIGFVGNLSIKSITIINTPNLSSVSELQHTSLTDLTIVSRGALFTSIDLSGSTNLTTLSLADNELSNLDLTNNSNLEYLSVAINPLTSLNTSNLTELQTLHTYESQITLLDISSNKKLTTINSDNGALSFVNLRNGFNNLLTSVELNGNPSLNCIYVDDVTFAETATDWKKDNTADYIDELIINNAQDKTVEYDGNGNQDDLDDWIAINGEAQAIDCLEATWSYAFFASVDIKTFPDGAIDDIKIVYEFDFFATDIFGNQSITAAKFTITNARHFNSEFYGTGNTVCENSKNLNDIVTKENGDFNASLTDSDITKLAFEQIEGPSGISGETATFDGPVVDFPDTPAGSYTYRFKTTIEKSIPFYDPQNESNNLITITDETDITINDKTFPLETQEILCPDTTISSIQDLSDLLVFDNLPDGYSFNPNPYWTPNTFNGPGTYKFDPSSEFPGCSAIPISVTILEPLTIEQNPERLSIDYNPQGNDNEINAWLNNNGGGIVTGTNVAWNYKLDKYEKDIAFEALICNMLFTATDICGNKEVFPVDIEIFGFPLLVELDISNDVICDKSFNLDGFNGTNLNSSKYDNSNISVTGPGTISGIDIDFPDSGAGSFSYQYMVTVSTDISIGTTSINVTDNATWTLDPVIAPFNPGVDKTYTICSGQTTTLMELYNQFEIVDGTDDSSFNPDDFWFNSNGDKITAYSGPGNYIFNAQAFLPDCGGIPATVTVIEEPQLNAGEDGALEITQGSLLTEEMLFSALESNPDSGGTWSPKPSGIGTYTYTHGISEVCPESSAIVEVTESALSIDEYNLNNIYLYPNPTKDFTILKGNIFNVDKIEILSISGKLLFTKRNNFNTIDLTNVPNGIYFVHVSNNRNQTKSFKVIRE